MWGLVRESAPYAMDAFLRMSNPFVGSLPAPAATAEAPPDLYSDLVDDEATVEAAAVEADDYGEVVEEAVFDEAAHPDYEECVAFTSDAARHADIAEALADVEHETARSGYFNIMGENVDDSDDADLEAPDDPSMKLSPSSDDAEGVDTQLPTPLPLPRFPSAPHLQPTPKAAWVVATSWAPPAAATANAPQLPTSYYARALPTVAPAPSAGPRYQVAPAPSAGPLYQVAPAPSAGL